MGKKLNTSASAQRFAKMANQVASEQKAVERTDIIPISSIVMNEDNIFGANDSDESIAALAQNIKENGLLHNIVVEEIAPDKYLLISGERRTKAMIYLGEDKIRATIKKDLTDFDVLKMLFFANSETREYSTEEKIQIIESFLVKIKRFEESDKEAAKKFKEYVAQAFNVSERQANKLISITSELILPLKELLYADSIDINTAAALAQLPEDYQKYAMDILQAASDDSQKKIAVENALTFAKKAKNVISKTNTALTKERTSRAYYNDKLEKANEELAQIEAEMAMPDADIGDLETKRLAAESKIADCNAHLNKIEATIDVETQKQHTEVEKVFNNSAYATNKALDNTQQDKTGKIAQAKKIAKEIHTIDLSLNKLRDMHPTEELGLIQELVDKYKNDFEKNN